MLKNLDTKWEKIMVKSSYRIMVKLSKSKEVTTIGTYLGIHFILKENIQLESKLKITEKIG